jgi:hypothetical protein
MTAKSQTRLLAGGGGAVTLALCALALGACGIGDGGNLGVADRTDEEAALEFAECMREHGVDVPDPQPGGGPIEMRDSAGPGGDGPDTQGAIGGAPIDLDDPETQEAMEACEDELGDAGPQALSERERQEAQEAALRYAQCMRDNGIDMPDPSFSDGPGGGFLIQQQAGDDAHSPAFRAAARACQDELPQPPGSGDER